MPKSLYFVALLALAACAKDAPPTGEAPDEDVAEYPGDKCPIISSRDWTAWVDAEPPGPATLHIRGSADLPTPGYVASWQEGLADRAMPPGVQFILSFEKPAGMVAQVITTEALAYAGEATYSAYRVISIMCGGEKIAEITDIPIAQ